MSISKKIVRKLFFDPAYGVAYRKRTKGNAKSRPYSVIRPTYKEWYADPFVFHYQGVDCIFAEIYKNQNMRGTIAVSIFQDGKFGEFREIIKEPFHMSFPNVFMYNGEIYMIPETYQSNQLRLYKCIEFPYNWGFECSLINDVELVDTIILFYNSKIFLLAHDISDVERKHNRLFELNMGKKSVKEIFTKNGNFSQERPGGNFYCEDNKIYHANQDCVNCYGDFLHFYEILDINETCFDERLVKDIHVQDIQFDSGNHFEHIHTYNCNTDFEVIDFRYNKFYFNKAIRRIQKKNKNKQYQLK